MSAEASAALRRAAAAVVADADALTRSTVALISAELPDLAPDARIRGLLTATVLDNLVGAMRVVMSDDDVDMTAPPVSLEFARRLAQQGVALTSLLRAYRLGQATLQQQLIARIAAERVSAQDMAAASITLSSVAFAFIDRVSEQVVVAYQLERDNWLRHRNASRLARVQALLDGGSTAADADDAERTLGFALSVRHVGAVLWSAPDSDDGDRLAHLERDLGSLTAALGAAPRAALSVAPDDATLWAWVPAAALDVGALEAALGGPTSALHGHVALGRPATGPDGFRRTHQQALQAQRLALTAHAAGVRPLTASTELGPLALVASDADGIRSWVLDVLGELACDDDATARLRETVWAYLSSGSSLNTAAAELHLHKNTIQYRVRKAEDVRGRPLTDGRIDVEVALLATRLLGATVLRPPATES